MFGWFGKRSLEETPIDAGLWHRATAPYLFARGLPAADLERLRGLAGRFLARKHFSGTHGLEVTGLMHVQVAAQASILVLELGLEWYDGWSEIIVYPGQFAPEREIVDEAGVVHLVNDPMAGEAWLGGPVILSEAYADFCRRVDRADRLARRDGGRALDELPIDPYASENPGEFFAVVSEAFFETPEWLEPAYPAVYSQLRQFYRQDPLARLGAERA
jgi:Mlc titration factor MtfA (ptsG expression regulator)